MADSFSDTNSLVAIDAPTPAGTPPPSPGRDRERDRKTVVTRTLNSLQSEEQLKLLNEIDKLRSHGVNDFVSLPQLVVCGDQSSGKSSVLEAITEIPFPRRDNLCTRFATQIMLRRSPTTHARVKIIPDSGRNSADRAKLEAFTGEIKKLEELPDLVEDAKAVMGIDDGEGAFCKDTLSIEISGPDKPVLTIVDLPGLIHMGNKNDVEIVSDLVHRYMTDQRTIILAVVTAKNDYANQIVLKRAKEADPEGSRTLGIITKPDTLSAGSASESDFVNLAKNKDIFFKLGWHVLRNRNYEERDCSFEERHRLEREFFSRGAWRGVDNGIESLRSRLSVLLLNHIKRELPRVHQEIVAALRECEAELELLGTRRTTPEEQRMVLLRASEVFGGLCKSAVEGTYEHMFFGLTQEHEGSQKRLRAQVQALGADFAKKMRLKGHTRQIVEHEEDITSQNGYPQAITRAQAMEWVRPLLLGGRGRELPGTFNPLLISELFWEQSKGWEAITRRHLKKVYRKLNGFLRLALVGVAPPDVIEGLFANHIDQEMAERFQRANKELEGLLNDRRRHAITYNHYYTENVQKIRDRRLKEQYEAVIEAALQQQNKSSNSGAALTKAQLMQAISTPTEASMEDYACQEALDSMLAFYKVAYKTFVDNVATIVVERRLVGDLWEIFSPLSVVRMSYETIAAVCEEAPEDQKRRDRLENKRISLAGGLEVTGRALRGVKCDRSTLHHDSDDSDDSDAEDPADAGDDSDEEGEECYEEDEESSSINSRKAAATTITTSGYSWSPLSTVPAQEIAKPEVNPFNRAFPVESTASSPGGSFFGNPMQAAYSFSPRMWLRV
ncbi:dynamin family protein-like protein [Tricharina praecox]|uniref:dynamin family protein-like protein n=1 Tax=Tricharina praecox TaxID=43433 RepID=UPI00221E43EC|nr:dynamin family protein-like protein [Tricharina praecox]KAI5841700.1 dynamin family protein-like protein [Tricharina praecox]